MLFAFLCLVSLGEGVANIGERDVRKLKFNPLEYVSAGPSGQIGDIAQGPDGFIWFGTQEGVHRFDGYEVRSFANRKDDPNSLINSVALVFYIDPLERFWIGTEKGVARYLPETDSFRNYYLDPSALNSNLANHANAFVRDAANRIYVSSESGYIYRYDESEDSFERVNEQPLGIIKSMELDGQDRIWVGAESQLHVYDLSSGDLTTYSSGLEPEDPSVDNFIGSICYVDDETIWLATATRGAVIFNSRTGEITETVRQNPSENYVHVLMRDEKRRVWAGHSGGISIFDPKGKLLARYGTDSVEGPLPASGIHSILLDKQGNVWAGSAFHGAFVSINGKKFNSLAHYGGRAENEKTIVSSLMEDSDGNLWAGLNSTGIDVFPADGGPVVQLRHDPSDPHSLPLHTVFTIFEDSFGEIWVGAYRGGLQRYRPETGDFEHYVNRMGDPSSLAGNDVRGIQEDSEGNLWILTHGRGVSYFDRSSGSFARYLRDSEAPEESLIDNWANAILLDSRGDLFVGTAIGLSILDTETGSFRNFEAGPRAEGKLSDPVINVIYEDSEGRIWIGTGDGLNLFDPSESRFRSWSTEEGLANRVVNSIVEDSEGHLWIGTSDGLSRFDPRSEDFDNYDESDGLSDSAFFPRSVIKSADGMLYFGMKDGVTYFDPTEIVDNTFLPEVWISDFKVFNQSLEVDPEGKGRGSLETNILEAERVILDYRQKVISISFVALNFVQSSKNRYAYKLEGFDRDWNFVGTRREATYTNLNPGSYLFKVKAANNDGYWNNTPRTFAILIKPPFWGTLGFRVAVGVLIILIPATVVFVRLRSEQAMKARLESTVRKRTTDLRKANEELEKAYSQLARNQTQIKTQNVELVKHRENLESMVSQRTQELETAKEKAERSDRLKSAFLANMSHEIRTPMNAIIGLLDVMRIESLSPSEKNEYAEVIRKSSDTLMTLIDDILDLSRIESGEANIVPQLCNCDELCEEIYALFRHVASVETGGAVELKLERDGKLGASMERAEDLILPGFDPVRLKQIISNLLSNAIKFTEKGEITMGYRIEQAKTQVGIVFFVRDTGIGIAAAQVDRVFDRFHKIDSANGKVYRGTGLGLTISKRLAELMGGTITVESTEGVGTTFYAEFKRPLKTKRVQGRVIDPEAVPKAGAGDDPEDVRLAGVRVLIAEDEVPNYLVLKKYLESSGAITTWAKDGNEAVSLFDSQGFDIALLDVKLPYKDGFEVLNHIRSLNTDIPVVVQTAYAMENDQQRASELGASAFIAKPFNRPSLISMVASLVEDAKV